MAGSADDFRRIKQDWTASRDARAATVSQMLASFQESLVKFRKENRESIQSLDKMLADFRTKSRENTKQIVALAEKTANFLLDSCHKDQARARGVYKLFDEVARMLKEFSEESEKRAQEIVQLFRQFDERDVDRKEQIAELCRTAYLSLETLSRRRHERREDVQVVLGQLRLENRQRLEWMASMLAKLRADERDRNEEFEAKDNRISRDVKAMIDQFAADKAEAGDTWNELKSAVELMRAADRQPKETESK